MVLKESWPPRATGAWSFPSKASTQHSPSTLKDMTLSPSKPDTEKRVSVRRASRLKKSAAVILVLILAAPFPAESSETPKSKRTPAAAPAAAEYTIGPDDLLVVNVWKEPEISRNVVVRPDGKISLPL